MFYRGLLVGLALVFGLTYHAGASVSERVADRHVMAGGEFMFMRPENFGLAVHRDQLVVKSVVPPCDEGFDYCLYYMGEELTGTNFRSAGVRIERLEDMDTAEACLFTPPKGYLDFQPTVHREGDFAVSVFAPIQNAGMGHYSDGKLIRLAFGDETCLEVETRIGMSQFAHYPKGSIREFTQEEKESMAARLDEVVRNIRLVDRPLCPLVELRSISRPDGQTSISGDSIAERWDG